MFNRTQARDRTKLPHDPFRAIVAPRSLGWISTRTLDGRINLAPYSFFNGFASAPRIVGFSSEGWKDSVSFAKESGEFVASLATRRGSPRARPPWNARVVEVVEITSVSGKWSGSVLTIGEVVAFHIDDQFIADRRFDTARAHALACGGYQDCAAVESVFSLPRRKGGGAI